MIESRLMTKDDIIKYVKENFDFFKEDDEVFCQEIGDGNINYVFRLYEEKSNKSLVVKQADVLLRSSGRPLDIHRSKIEAEVLIFQERLAPGFVPKVYGYDEERALLVMEDISAYKNLRYELLNGKDFENLADQLSDFLSLSLFPTSDLVLDRKEKKEFVKKFINPELCDITEDLVLTEPYYNYKNRNIITSGLENLVKEKLYDDEDLHFEILKLKDRFQNYAQGLLHGDLHSGSIFVNESGIKVIDPEFAFYGPIGYDIGNVWGNLVFPICNFFVRNENEEKINRLIKLLAATIDKTVDKLFSTYDREVSFGFYKNPSFRKKYIEEIISDSFGYAATEIIRRTVGDSKVKEVSSITDLETRKKLDTLLINIGVDLVKNRDKYNNGQDIIRLVKREFEAIKWLEKTRGCPFY